MKSILPRQRSEFIVRIVNEKNVHLMSILGDMSINLLVPPQKQNPFCSEKIIHFDWKIACCKYILSKNLLNV